MKNSINNSKQRTLANKIMLNNDINVEWFQKQVLKGRIEQQLVNGLPLMIEQLNDVYEGNWDLQLHLTMSEQRREYSVKPLIVIKFDSFTISNSTGYKFVIKDLYVAFIIKSLTSRCYVSDLYGARGEINVAEYQSEYEHSHLQSNNYGGVNHYTEFCLGTGAIVSAILMVNGNWTANIIKLFLLQIREYVAWESLEGVPYMKIEDIFIRLTGMKISLEAVEITELHKNVDNYLNTDDFDLELVNGCYQIVDNAKFGENLAEILPEKYKVRISPQGKEYPLNSDGKVTRQLRTDVIWKKEPLKYIKVSNKTDLPLHTKNNISTRIKSIVLKYLNAKLTKTLMINE